MNEITSFQESEQTSSVTNSNAITFHTTLPVFEETTTSGEETTETTEETTTSGEETTETTEETTASAEETTETTEETTASAEETTAEIGETTDAGNETTGSDTESGSETTFVTETTADPGGSSGVSTGLFAGIITGLGIVIVALTLLLLLGNRKKTQKNAAVKVGKLHRQGRRENQQDCFGVSPEHLIDTQGLLAVVADGMGGLEKGEKVSEVAVTSMLSGFLSSGNAAPVELLLSLTKEANRQVNDALGSKGIGKSGSTLVAVLVKHHKLHYISVGDSRLCLFRKGQLIQLNREHIYRQELSVDAINSKTQITEALTRPDGSGLTSFLGMGKLKYVDIPSAPMEIQRGDKFILMSDGVYNALSADELSYALKETPELAVRIIDKKIMEKNYREQDNYTAVVLGF